MLLRALWPLFRYSHWRDAWVLRLIGERFGAVLIVPRAATIRPRRIHSLRAAKDQLLAWRAAGSGMVMLRSAIPAVSSILFAALLGFTIAWMTASGVSVRPSAQASAGLLNAAIPPQWRQQSAPAATPFHLTDELELRRASGAGSLIIGRSSAPQSLVSQTVQGASVTPLTGQTTTLSGARFVRYVIGPSPRSESVFLLPTTIGTIVGVCRPSSLTTRCEQILASLEVSPSARTVGVDSAYASSFSAIIQNLTAASSTAGTTLLKAGDASHEASAATVLAAADAKAAVSLLGLRAGTATAANSAVAAALQLRSQAYGALARAAKREDAAAYATARESVARAGTALTSAFSRLRSYGYQVG